MKDKEILDNTLFTHLMLQNLSMHVTIDYGFDSEENVLSYSFEHNDYTIELVNYYFYKWRVIITNKSDDFYLTKQFIYLNDLKQLLDEVCHINILDIINLKPISINKCIYALKHGIVKLTYKDYNTYRCIYGTLHKYHLHMYGNENNYEQLNDNKLTFFDVTYLDDVTLNKDSIVDYILID